MIHLRAIIALAIVSLAVACNTPCNAGAVMSCSDGSSCHEFYSDEAASAVYSTCIALGNTVTYAPCPASFAVCCVDEDGSFGNAEGICLPIGHPAASDLRANCDAPAKTLCER